MKYQLLIRTPVLGFHQEDKFLDILADGLKKAYAFYKLKKDRKLLNDLKVMLNASKLEFSKIKERIYKNVPDFEVEIVENEITSRNIYVEPFVLRPEILDDEGFYAQGFIGRAVVEIKPEISLKPFCLSYTEAILKRELKTFSEHSQVIRNILEELVNEIKNKWEIPLRIGLFNRYRLYEELVIFYRDRALRDYLKKRFRYFLEPIETLFLPIYKTVPGFIELRILK